MTEKFYPHAVFTDGSVYYIYKKYPQSDEEKLGILGKQIVSFHMSSVEKTEGTPQSVKMEEIYQKILKPPLNDCPDIET